MTANKERTVDFPGENTSQSPAFHGTRRIQIDPFFQVPLYSQCFSRGELQLPILLQDSNALFCMFVVSKDRVTQLLEGTQLEPVFVFGARALVGIATFDHHQSTVGSHLNMNLVIPVTRQNGFKRPSSWEEIRMNGDRRHMGFYVTDSALDNPVMLSAGKEVWGYPKFFAQMSARVDGSQLYSECNDADGRKGIARFSGSGARIMKLPSVDLTMFTLKQNDLLRSVINTRGHFDLHWPFGFRLQVGDSEHPMTQRLRFLGLDNARPVIVLSSTDYQARMNAGAVVDVLTAK